LKKYISHNAADPLFKLDKSQEKLKDTRVELEYEKSENALTFVPQFDDSLPKQYSEVNKDVSYQKGNFMQQWTILFDNPLSEERATVSVRYSEFLKEFIEFDVEVNSIPMDDQKGKDITMNWVMLNGFNPKGTFWTDSNGLPMQKREIVNYNTTFQYLTKQSIDYKNISRNYYPVDSAIAMRDY
jgi:hypothetical protein